MDTLTTDDLFNTAIADIIFTAAALSRVRKSYTENPALTPQQIATMLNTITDYLKHDRKQVKELRDYIQGA